jgi:hypothetical protein
MHSPASGCCAIFFVICDDAPKAFFIDNDNRPTIKADALICLRWCALHAPLGDLGIRSPFPGVSDPVAFKLRDGVWDWSG